MIGSLFDTYVRRARIYPVLLTILPVTLTVFVLFQNNFSKFSILWSLILSSGGFVLISQVGRDWGKKIEASLFLSWAGAPTTRMLRYRYAQNNTLHSHRLRKIQEISGIRVPTIEEEQLDGETADRIYETCVAVLREKTRDKSKFALLFEENCNYGFRRNLLGLKPVGVVISFVGVVIFGWLSWLAYKIDQPLDSMFLLFGGINLLLLLGWIFYIRPGWVRISAEAYAERLLGALDSL
jgi:hypothetical protein